MTTEHLKPGAPPPATGAMSLEVLGMGKRFGDVIALDDVSLKIPAGGFHALLGENGAGKSTLVKCLVGFYTPDTGAVVIDGRETEIATPRDASRGFMCRVKGSSVS